MTGRRALPLVVGVVLSVATIAAGLQSAAVDRQAARERRQHAIEKTSQAVSALGAGLEARVSDVAGLFDASQEVTGSEFSAFTDPMIGNSRAASISFVELVALRDRPAHEQRIGGEIRELDPAGNPVPAHVRRRYGVVTYTKTLDDNEAEIGADVLASGPESEAIAAAERTRSPQSTRAIDLPAGGQGIVIYVPVYGPTAVPTAERRPIGFVSAAFRFSDLAPLLAPLVPDGASVRLSVSDQTAFEDGSLTGPVGRTELLIAGRKWQVAVTGEPVTPIALGLTRSQLVTLLLGLLTLIVTAFTRQAVVGAERSDELASLRATERDEAVRERESTEQIASELLAHLPDLAVLRVDADLRIVSASGGLLARAGWRSEELVGNTVRGALGDEADARIGRPLRAALGGEASGFTHDGIRAASLRYWIQTLPLPGQPGALFVVSDITAQLSAESARQEAEARFERVFDSAPVGMAVVDTTGRFVQVNDAMAAITGHSIDRLLTMGPPDVTHPEDLEVTKRQVHGLLSGTLPVLSVEKRYLHADGHVIWVALNATVLHDAAGEPEFILAHILDVTENHEFAEQLQHLATHDPLTDLRNRRSFEESLETQVALCRRYQEPSALLTIDLDHFKAVNDTLGHQAGDRVLTGAADTLRLVLRQSDTIGRLGGDEFAVLLPKSDTAAARIVARKVCDGLRELGERLAKEHGGPVVTASVGYALLDGTHRTGDEAMADADAALYSAKIAGRNGAVLAPRRTRHAA